MSAVPDITVDPRVGSARDVVEAPAPTLTVDYLVGLAFGAITRGLGQWGKELSSADVDVLERHLRERMAQAVQVHLNTLDELGFLELRDQRDQARAELEELREQTRARQLSDALHPNGRCTCGGEGQCTWCRRIEEHEELRGVVRVLARRLAVEMG